MATHPEIDIEAMRRGYELVSRREFDKAMSIYHPEIEWRDPPGLPGGGVHRGKEAVRASWESWGESWEEWELTPGEFIVNGDQLFAEVTVSGRGRGSGLEVSLTYFQVWSYRDGLVIRQRGFADRDEALAAAGLDPAT